MHSKSRRRPRRRAYTIVRADALSWLKSLPECSVDLIVTDPPYESIEKHRAIGTTTRLKISKGSSNVWFSFFPNEHLASLMVELYRVLKNNCHCYVFCDQETAFLLKPLGESAGFKFWKPIIWDKMVIGMGYHYRAQYEMILFFEKGKRRLSNLGIADVLKAKRVRNGYPTEKPALLGDILIHQSSSDGEIVCDPFCGSGTFGAAALRAGRNFLGCDLSSDACALSEEKISNAHAQFLSTKHSMTKSLDRKCHSQEIATPK